MRSDFLGGGRTVRPHDSLVRGASSSRRKRGWLRCIGVWLSAAMMGEVNYDAIPHVETESAVGFDVYFFGHDLKWTNEFSLTRWSEFAGQPEDIRIRRTWVRSQLQFGFRGL